MQAVGVEFKLDLGHRGQAPAKLRNSGLSAYQVHSI